MFTTIPIKFWEMHVQSKKKLNKERNKYGPLMPIVDVSGFCCRAYGLSCFSRIGDRFCLAFAILSYSLVAIVDNEILLWKDGLDHSEST